MNSKENKFLNRNSPEYIQELLIRKKEKIKKMNKTTEKLVRIMVELENIIEEEEIIRECKELVPPEDNIVRFN